MMVAERAGLRIKDLKNPRGATTLMNVKIPSAVADAIAQLATRLGTSRTDVVVALLNEGLAMVPKKIPGHRRPPAG
jgi:hypothetical protein